MGSGDGGAHVSLCEALDLLCQAAAFKSPHLHIGSHCWCTHRFHCQLILPGFPGGTR